MSLLRLLIPLILIAASVPARALENPGTELKEVGLATVAGQAVDLDLVFTDSHGIGAPLGELIAGEIPTIVVPAYYTCPRLCGLLLDGVSRLVKKLSLTLGSDYRVLTVSFDPEENVTRAGEKERHYRNKLGEEPGTSSWKFLLGSKQNVTALMSQLGFQYQKDGNDFAHTSAIFLLTPDGRISQYFAGIDFSPRDVRLALVEASKGAIGSVIDQILLFCFRFDPTKGKYTWAAVGVMRAGGGLTMLLLTGLIFGLWRRERKRSV